MMKEDIRDNDTAIEQALGPLALKEKKSGLFTQIKKVIGNGKAPVKDNTSENFYVDSSPQ